jgi:tryptophan synthase beta subunit
MNDIQRIISSTLPQQDMNDMTRLLEAFLQASGGGNNTVGNPVAPPSRERMRIRIWKKPGRTSSRCSRTMIKGDGRFCIINMLHIVIG